MQHLSFNLSFTEKITDPTSLKSAPIRAGLFGNLAYVLATANASWQIPDHFSSGKGLLLFSGGGGAGGDDQKNNIPQGVFRHTGENGAATLIFFNETFISRADGGKHGNSSFTNLGTRQRARNGGGLGGVLQTPPQDGTNYASSTALNSASKDILALGKGGSAGKKLTSSANYNGIGGGGAGGYIPFADENPENWHLPTTINSTTSQSGTNGSGFGAGGGGAASRSYTPKIGTSGGSYAPLVQKYFDYSPGDVLKFQIGVGGKIPNRTSPSSQDGTNGFVLLYLQNAPRFFPHELPSPNVENYRITPINQTIRSVMEFGSVRQRRLSMQNRMSLQCSWLFTESEFRIFSRWFYHDIKNGSAYFLSRIKNPYDDDRYQFVRFAQPYQARLVSTHMWRVDAEMDYIQNNPPKTYS